MKKFLAGDPATERLAACDAEAEFYRPFLLKGDLALQHLLLCPMFAKTCQNRSCGISLQTKLSVIFGSGE